ncbi:MAG: NAD(P)-dependent oxidoreductase [Elusimicrobiales bacterium]|nr:NAD(P)-dependent oxidoreductase [Elusimicrobiales bacterium]
MNVLITGGLGYVGGRLAERLGRQPDCRVLLADLPVKGALPAWAEKFKVLPIDVLDKRSLAAAFAETKADAVIHLAALNDAQCARDPELAAEVNTKGTYNVLEAAAAAGTQRCIYFSTFHVYGPAAGDTISEATPAMPAHPYGTTHRAAEDWVSYFRAYKGMKTLIFRMSNSFGCPMDKDVNAWTLVFNDLCRQLQTAGAITLKSAGTQHRDFITLSDAAEAVRYFLFDIPEEWGDGLYNLGSGTSLSILDAARRVEKVYEAKYGRKPGAITTGPAATGAAQPKPVNYVIDKLKAAGFTPAGSMDAEIEKTLTLCEQFR